MTNSHENPSQNATENQASSEQDQSVTRERIRIERELQMAKEAKQLKEERDVLDKHVERIRQAENEAKERREKQAAEARKEADEEQQEIKEIRASIRGEDGFTSGKSKSLTETAAKYIVSMFPGVLFFRMCSCSSTDKPRRPLTDTSTQYGAIKQTSVRRTV